MGTNRIISFVRNANCAGSHRGHCFSPATLIQNEVVRLTTLQLQDDGDDDGKQIISGNAKRNTKPKYDLIGPMKEVEVAPIRGKRRRKIERSMMKLVNEAKEKIGADTMKELSVKELSEKVFDILDINGGGVLQKSELVRAGLDFDAANILDMNRDGEIQKEEFLSGMEMTFTDEATGSITGDSAFAARQFTMDASDQILSEDLEDSLGELQPLERQELRLGSFESCILISVLTASSSYETIKYYNTDWTSVQDIDATTAYQIMSDLDSLKEFMSSSPIIKDIDWFVVGIQLSSAVSALLSIYSTTVFSLSILYGMTALGLDRDVEYFVFMENTGMQRFRAFRAFSLGLFSWAVSFFLVICDHAPPIFKLPVFIGSVALLVFAKDEYDMMMASAAPVLNPRKWKK